MTGSCFFPTWLLLFHSVENVVIKIDFHIFQRGRLNHQPDKHEWFQWATVDGRNPAPVERWHIPLFISTIQGGAGHLPFTVSPSALGQWWDFAVVRSGRSCEYRADLWWDDGSKGLQLRAPLKACGFWLDFKSRWNSIIAPGIAF